MSTPGSSPPSLNSGFPCPTTDESDRDICPETLGPTRILPHLYVGCMQDALNQQTRQQHEISYIINVTLSCPKPDDVADENFLRIPINDGYIDKLLPHLEQAAQFIDMVRQRGDRVLVHCMAGISRSAALTIAYIMKTQLITCEQAYRMVKAKRSIVSPNFNFLGQLLEYEKELNLTTSPCSGAAGIKRKRFDLDLKVKSLYDSTAEVTNPTSPVHSKRLHVTKNNNTITSLSPASAMANLKFEHTLEKLNSLPATSDSQNMSNFLSACPLNPPKRCHSWNGLAELASKPDSPDSPTGSVKHRKVGLQAIRPRSLNLSMSNIAVPAAVLQLNAQVEHSLSTETNQPVVRDLSQIPNIAEELEVSTSDSDSSRNASYSSIKDAISAKAGPGTILKNLDLPFQKQFNESVNSSRVGQTVACYLKKPATAISDLSASQPSLTVSSSSDSLPPDIKSFMNDLATINWTPPKFNSITPARTAPSNLDKSTAFYAKTRYRGDLYGCRKAKSLENLISPVACDDTTLASVICMKCGRTDKGNMCHCLTTDDCIRRRKQQRIENRIERPSSLCGSSEMIPVS